MTSLSDALMEAVKFVVPAAAGWIMKLRRDVNRLYTRVRQLEAAEEARQIAAATSGAVCPTCGHRGDPSPLPARERA